MDSETNDSTFNSTSTENWSQFLGNKSSTVSHISKNYSTVTVTEEFPGLTPQTEYLVVFLITLGATILISAIVLVRLIILQIRYRYVLRRNPELLQLLTKIHAADIEKAVKLKKTTDIVMKSDLALEHFLSINIGTNQDDQNVSEENLLTIPTCRYPNIKCSKLNHVQLKSATYALLHVNRIDDYFGEPFYLTTAPIQLEFPHYWNMIDQEQIGVIVWLGKAKEENLEKFTPYVPLRTLLSERHGDYIIKNISNMPEVGYIVYFLATKNVGSSWKKENIVLIYFHAYPMESLPKDLSKFSDVVAVVQLYHEEQIKQNNLNGVLIHHTAGVNRSAAFVAMYIGRQMWLDQSKINIKGILKYVRKYRHGAFTTFGDSAKQVQFVYQIMESLVKRMGGKSCKKIENHRIIHLEKYLYFKLQDSFTKLKGRQRGN